MRWIVIGGIVALAFVGASMLATYGYGRFAERARGEPSYALDRGGSQTPLDERIASLTAGKGAGNGLVMLSSNLDAFAARALSARAAHRSLDLMYYIWNDDLTGQLLMRETIAAAERGVRVRLLLDDIGVSGFDKAFLALASHPNIELRLFNPTRARENVLRRGLEMALRAFSVTRRMHNKAWIVDGRVAIVGGRNIGDEYFDAAEASNFRDLDLLAVGPVVRQTEHVFDDYWNSGLALPIAALTSRTAPAAAELQSRLQEPASSEGARPYIDRLREHVSLDALLGPGAIHWSEKVELVSDPPEKALGERGKNWLMEKLLPVMTSATNDLEITSPYFIPGEEGVRQLTELAQAGVSVSILTNSLSATDVAAVHGGYAPYREPLLAGGAQLFELKREGADADLSLRGSSQASLHTKAFTVDDRIGFIGSLNLDPRSVSLNTEMGVLFEVPKLVETMRVLFRDQTSPGYSYKVLLDANGSLLACGGGRSTVDLQQRAGHQSRASPDRPDRRLPTPRIATLSWERR